MSAPVQLSDGVVRLGTRFVNWYLVADEAGVTVVDAAVPGYRPQLEPGLALIGRGVGDIRAVLLTHGDADHTGLASAIHAETAAPIHAHAGDRELLRNPKPKKTDGSLLGALLHPGPWQVLVHLVRNGAMRPPKVTEITELQDGAQLDVPGRPRVAHTPGHTPGHVIYHFPEHGALFVGDALCTWDIVSGKRGPSLMPRSMNVSTAQARDSLARVEEVDAQLVLAGHGEPWTGGAAAAAAKARAAGAS